MTLHRRPPLIAVVGDIALDYTLEVDRASAIDEKVAVIRSSRALGGTAANAAAQIVKLGGRANLVATVGDDPTGEWLLSEAARVGIGIDSVAQHRGDSTSATIVIDGVDRTVYLDLGVGSEVGVKNAVFDDAALIYVSYAPQIVRSLVERGFGDRLVVGLEHWMAEGDIGAACKGARLIITNSAGFDTLDWHELGSIVVTRGARGAELWSNGQLAERAPAVDVQALDPTGAGDSFAGALCYSIAAGSELTDAIRLAVVTAGLSTLAVGAQAGQPTMAVLEEFLGDKGRG